MTIQPATPQELFEFIFEAGIPDHYSWWEEFSYDFKYNDVPDDWVVEVTAEDPSEDGTITKRISRIEILAAVRKIHGDKRFVASLRNECANLLLSADDTDIDADDADTILQVAVYGEVVFG